MKNYFYILLPLLLIACKQADKSSDQKEIPEKTEQTPNQPNAVNENSDMSAEELFISDVEKAHKKKTFLNKAAIKFDIDLYFGGKQRLDATITMQTNSSKIKIEKKDGSVLLYDGSAVYLHPEDTNDQGARFGIFTWSYFFGFPYKLSDPGTKWEMQENRKLNDTSYTNAKLSFAKGTGDAPDDWYITYTDKNTNLIKAAAYIVTYGSKGDISKPESDPHMIIYENYQLVENIPIAHNWKFYGWTLEEGSTNQLGNATLSNIQFIKNPAYSLFTIPEKSKIIPAP